MSTRMNTADQSAAMQHWLDTHPGPSGDYGRVIDLDRCPGERDTDYWGEPGDKEFYAEECRVFGGRDVD